MKTEHLHELVDAVGELRRAVNSLETFARHVGEAGLRESAERTSRAEDAELAHLRQEYDAELRARRANARTEALAQRVTKAALAVPNSTQWNHAEGWTYYADRVKAEILRVLVENEGGVK